MRKSADDSELNLPDVLEDLAGPYADYLKPLEVSLDNLEGSFDKDYEGYGDLI